MDDLRWILLLVGVAVLVAIYFSGRLEGEGWARERKQSHTGRRDKTDKKATRGGAAVKKEPKMGAIESEPHAPNDEPVANISKANPISPISPTAPHAKTVTKADEKMPPDKQTAHAEYSGIEDEITEIEIPIDLAEAEAEIHIADIVLDEAPEQIAIPAGMEPLVLSVSVFADEGESFSGPEIKTALEAEGLLHGAMRIFHFHDPAKKDISKDNDAVFSVASVLEPGFFNLEKLDEMQTPGLMLFCQLPGPLPGDVALDIMLDKGRGLAVRLHGHMCDDKRNRFTTQAKNHYLDRVVAFNRELVLARSLPRKTDR